MERQTQKLNFSDGAGSEMICYSPSGALQAVVLILPAMGVRASYYEPFAKAFAEQGLLAACGELRGHGSSSVRPSRRSDFGYEEMLQLELPLMLGALRETAPQAPLFLLGHSLGGHIGCMAASRYPGLFDGLILVASGSVYYKGWKGLRRIGILFITQFFHVVAQLWGYFPGHLLGFGGKEARGLIRDWSLLARSGSFEPAGASFDYEKGFAAVRLPVLSISFEADRMAPASAARQLLQKFPAQAPKRAQLFEGAAWRHLSHFNWVKQHEALLPLVLDWIQEQREKTNSVS